MNLWSGLPRREKLMVGGAVALLLAALLYLMIIAPFRARLAGFRDGIPAKMADLAWMQNAARQAEQLKGSAGRPRQVSPLKAIDINARQYGIAGNLKRLDPGDNDRIKVWFEDLVFVDLINFLRKLDQDHSIEVVNITAEKIDGPGLVNARVTFRAGQK